MNCLEKLENKWGVFVKDDIQSVNPKWSQNIQELNTVICKNVGLTSKMCVESVQKKYEEYTEDVVEVYNTLNANNEFENLETRLRINRVLEIIHYCKLLSISHSRIQSCLDVNVDCRDEEVDGALFRFKPIDTTENTPYQNLLLFILNNLYEKGYKRYMGDVYESITTDEGYNTRSWQRIDSIQNLVYAQIQKELRYDQFLNFTYKSDSARSVTEFLTNCKDSQFQSITKDRHIFSFKNGVYFSKIETDTGFEDKFVPYSELTDNVTSSKYFDLTFHDYTSWRDVPTPKLDSILKYQDIPEDVIYWVYVFIGRLIYEVNEIDNWQVIFFFQGQAGTGKSTITLNVCKALYDEEDVGILSNNIQRKFGLADIVDRKIFVAPEIKRDFALEQGEFQGMVSGDTITINEKYKKSRFVTWNVPGILAGNETPDFVDNYGSIQRRIVPIKFAKKVVNGDMMLGRKLSGEMGCIIKKCNCAYLDAVNNFAHDDIWKHLPEYFRINRDLMAAATNSLIHYLSCGSLVFGTNHYIPEKIFLTHFNEHCRENNYPKPRFNSDFYTGPFSQFNITVKKNYSTEYERRSVEGTFFFGVDIKKSIDEDDHL